MRYLLAGVGIGAGIAIGIAGMNIMGKVAYNAADTIITAGANKDPIYVEGQNESKFDKLINQINKLQNDDISHYCDPVRNAVYDSLGESFKHGQMSYDQYQKDLAEASKEYGGKCMAQYGWDNPYAPDGDEQYKKIFKKKVKDAWVGDQAWIEKKVNEYYK